MAKIPFFGLRKHPLPYHLPSRMPEQDGDYRNIDDNVLRLAGVPVAECATAEDASFLVYLLRSTKSGAQSGSRTKVREQLWIHAARK